MNTAKPRLTEVTGPELEAIMADNSDIGRPYVFAVAGHFFVNAEELKAWRCAQYKSEGGK